jgi:hypothetical protein
MPDRLASLMDGLKKVSNEIVHDPRTPSSRMKQRLETVRRETDTIGDYEKAGDEALGDVDGALSIFGALRRVARIESGTRRANFVSFDLLALYRVWP